MKFFLHRVKCISNRKIREICNVADLNRPRPETGFNIAGEIGLDGKN